MKGRINFNDFSLENLIDSMPENRPLYKDSGLWSVYTDDFDIPIISQNPNESLKDFIVRYYEFIDEFEDLYGVIIDLIARDESNI